MAPQRHVVTVTTNADGDGTGYTSVLSGRIAQIHYVKNDYADGVDFTITSEATGLSIWTDTNINASAVRSPRMLNYTTAGVAAQYAATFGVYEVPIVLAADRVKIVVAQGGATKSGTFHIVLE